MERFLCIHGHFYQPPRENPWLEAVEIQDNAFPYHDWNELITAECYAPNSASRILDKNGRIMDILSNYARMNFDMGPTLLSWLEKNAPETYSAILESDRKSLQWRSGHGAAMAQAYNHIIMPLANTRDKTTQCVWGIRDFQHRFRRDPEGMWVPETAVDLETLDILASTGIRFTVMAPHQAKRTRSLSGGDWADASGGKIDPSKAYICRLPSGREIALFFYDGPLSRAVAFEGLLSSGKDFADRLLSVFPDQVKQPQLMHIATDGESYGHHHRFGDMALSFALNYIDTNGLARVTNYGEFLEKHPPEDEVEIVENTSWSCSHGIERWRSDCGCSTGTNPGWSQKWRAPLREAMDWLRDELAQKYEQKAREYFHDPWAARDGYIDVMLDRSEESVGRFFGRHARTEFGLEDRITAIKLLELQRHAMLMFTSCGWFFDDLTGIETVQVIEYAGRAVQLSKEVFKTSPERDFTRKLLAAKSNVPQQGNGAELYNRRVKPRMVDLHKVAAHYAISSLFEDYPEKTGIYSYEVVSEDYRKKQAGKTETLTGKCTVRSGITGESTTLSYSVLHLGDHDFNCGIRRYLGERPYRKMSDEVSSAFDSGAYSDLVRLIDKYFGVSRYTLENLFKDEQRKILDTIIKETADSFEDTFRRLYEDSRILMGFLKDAGMPVTKAFLTAADFILNLDFKRLLMEEADAGGIGEVLEAFGKWEITPDAVDLEFTFRRTLESEMNKLQENPSDLPILVNMERLVDIALSLPFELNLWMMQNIYFNVAGTVYAEIAPGAQEDSQKAAWVESFRSLGHKLNFNLDSVLSR
jgi:alpha-amylase/alpha-mannosidase (GH57 family)